MNSTSVAATNPSQIVCKCGRDHRGTENHQCPIFKILTDLNKIIQDFLDYQEVFEFGKNGPMAHCLRTLVLEQYDDKIKEFEKKEATIKQHPEWHLADEIARLRKYFEQIADGCAEAKKTLSPRPPPSVIPSTNGDRESVLGIAQLAVNRFYDTCKDAIMDLLVSGKDPCDVDDSEGYLPKVDNAFKEAFEAIIELPRTGNATIKDLTEKSYEIWKESRRLLCEYDFH